MERKSKYTPEPWSIETGNTPLGDTGDSIPYLVIIANGFSIADIPVENHNYDDDEEPDANAARIVECVNALAGIENPAEFVQNAKTLLDKLKTS